jgi:tRNA pseudouridine55 synthase
MPETVGLDGLLLVDKAAECTSHDVVRRARHALGQRRIGHCGTLDPDATGLLLLTLGRATRLTRFLIRAPKLYEGEIRLGQATDTYDASGRITAEAPTEGVDLARVAAAMSALVGTHAQQPPPYCAKKVAGVRFYELARRGEPVPEAAKEVTIYDFIPLGGLTGDRIAFRLRCSSGTYARSLAHDLGRMLGCGAHLSRLRRLRIGEFDVADAIRLEELDGRRPGKAFIPFDRIPLPFGEVTTDAAQEARILHGQTVLVRDLPAEEGDWVKLLSRRQEFLAVGSVVERLGDRGLGVVQPRVVFKE